MQHLRKVLHALYDPTVLRNSSLAPLFGIAQERGSASALRRTLLQAIESLRPNESTPLGSKAWRIYQILRRRYTEQLTQREVAAALGLSTRQLQREEKLARQVLADHLWATHHLETQVAALTPVSVQADDVPPETEETDDETLTRAQELAWLRDSVPVQMVDVRQVIGEVIETIEPLTESSGVPVVYTPPENLPHIRSQAPMLRQAILNIVSIAIGCAPSQVLIETHAQSKQIDILVRADAGSEALPSRPNKGGESLEMAKQLVELCQGSLQVVTDQAGDPAFAAQITLVAEEQVTVLVVDDNADALQLLRRYMSGSRYRFVGAQSAQQGLDLLNELTPQVIVLDVMMPEQDGWTLLGQFREHPKTRDASIIVCTILPQEQLALTLGAAEFIRKPVNRSAFLAALDRQWDQLSKGPC